MHEGSSNVAIARMLIKALSCAGMDPKAFAHLPDMRPEVLADDRCRVSSATIFSMWEQLSTGDLGSAVGVEAATLVPVGHFGVWDYLFVTGENLIGSTRQALDHLRLVSDPEFCFAKTTEDGTLLTLRYQTTHPAPEVVEAVEIFAQAVLLRRVREATGRLVVPAQVAFRHAPSRRHARLVEAFGTANIVYGAPGNSLTFLEDDARAPLSTSPPGLQRILLEHADMVYAASKPVVDWMGMFRFALDMAFVQGDAPTLPGLARRLLMSPRSLQRRLAEHGTTWREEIEAARRERALALLRDTDLPLGGVAARLGYSDARTLRRSANRWVGQAPRALRQSPSESD